MSKIIVSMPGNEAFALKLGSALALPVKSAHIHSFPDGETAAHFQPQAGVDTAVVVCTLFRPNEVTLPLLLLRETLRDQGVGRVILASPYLAYMRQDTRFHPDEGISARYFAALLSRYCDGLVTVDPHLHRMKSLDEAYSVPTRVVHAAPFIADWIQSNIQRPVVMGPDSESAQWVSEVARRANAPYQVLQKSRAGDYDVEVSAPEADKLRDHTPVLVDDIISSGATMVAAIERIKARGLAAPVCVGVHGIFAGDGYDRLVAAGAQRLVTTNAIPHESNGIDVSPGVAAAIAEIL